MRTSNPTLRPDTFNRYAYLTGTDPQTRMTVNGAINKSIVLFGALLLSGIGAAALTISNPALGMPMLIGGAVVGFILALVISFKPNLAPTLSPVYAIAEGFAIGTISLLYEGVQSGIVFNAMIITASILGLMLLLYRTGIVRATPLFGKVMMFAIGGICVTYLVDIVMSMFGQHISMIHDSTPIGIGFSLLVCGIAAFSFILDFDFIEKGAQSGAPKFMEWYAGFSLLVTLVWLYLEVLRLLSKSRR